MRRDPALVPLSHQHHNGLALCVLTERALAGGATVEDQSRRVVERFDLEMVNHFELEEQILFPALSSLPLVAQLISEHREISAIVERLRAAPRREDLDHFISLIRRHIRMEENDLFAQAQQLLPCEQLAAIGEILDARAIRVQL